METVFHCNDKAFLHHLQRMFAARRDSFIARALLDRSRLLLILVDNPVHPGAILRNQVEIHCLSIASAYWKKQAGEHADQ